MEKERGGKRSRGEGRRDEDEEREREVTGGKERREEKGEEKKS